MTSLMKSFISVCKASWDILIVLFLSFCAKSGKVKLKKAEHFGQINLSARLWGLHQKHKFFDKGLNSYIPSNVLVTLPS